MSSNNSKAGAGGTPKKVRGFSRRADEDEVALIADTTAHLPKTQVLVGSPTAAATAILGGATDDSKSAASDVEELDTGGTPGKKYTIGSVDDVPLGELYENKYNARKTPAKSKIEDLAKSLQADGQETAVTAYVSAEGKVCLIDGGRRLAAARIAGLSTLRVEFRPEPASPKELYLHSRRANSEREDQNPLDDAIAWEQLLADGVYKDQKEISIDTGIDEGIVSKILGLRTLPKTLVAIITEYSELVKLRMLTAIRRFYDETQQNEEATERLILEIRSKGLSARAVEEKISAMSEPKKTRVRADDSWSESYGTSKVSMKRFGSKNSLTLEVATPDDPQAVIDLEVKIKKLIEESFRKQD